jgi:hypothetical protein
MTTTKENEMNENIARADAALAEMEARREMLREAHANPVVGMPATFNIGSDHYATEVTAVSPSKHRIETTKGVFTRRSNGRYIMRGGNYGSLTLGIAETRLDPSF